MDDKIIGLYASGLSTRDIRAHLEEVYGLKVGPEISVHRALMAAGLARGDPVFAFPPAVRKIIYTTNAIESLNRVIRKTTKTRDSFPLTHHAWCISGYMHPDSYRRLESVYQDL